MAEFFGDLKQIRARPAFDDQCTVTIENFRSLVGEYQLPESVYCQLHRDGHLCNTEHNHGWLAATKEGKEGLIGCVCAGKHFRASRTFALERNRIRRELKIKDHVERLTQILADPSYPVRVEAAIARLRSLDHEIEHLRGAIPMPIVLRLTQMGRSRAPTNASVEYRYEEREKDGGLHVSYVEQVVASIAGSAIWDFDTVRGYAETLNRIRATLAEAKPEPTAGERCLAAWLLVLDELPQVERRVDRLQEEHDQFTSPSNLRVLWLLTRRFEDQRTAVKVALLAESSETPSNERAQRVLNHMKNEIRAANAGRDFREM